MHKLKRAAAILLCASVAIVVGCKAGDQAGSGRSTTLQAQSSQSANTSGAQPQPAASPTDGVERISIADARAAADEGRAVFLDVRSQTEFDRGHIKGAISLPKGQIPERSNQLPKGKLIITYCA